MAARWLQAEDEARVSWSEAAFTHLSALGDSDPVMAELATAFGPPSFVPRPNYYAQLLRAIVGQQLAGKAMAAIFGRVLSLVGDPPEPSSVAARTDDELRACGLSR